MIDDEPMNDAEGVSAEDTIDPPVDPGQQDHVYDAFDDIADSLSLPGGVLVAGPDGLPTIAGGGGWGEGEMPLDPDTLICMADPAKGRPPCNHYVRQMMSLAENPEHQQVYRLCSARQSRVGAFLDVSGGVWACTIRDPADPATEQRLDDFDQKKITLGQQRQFKVFK